MATSAPSSSTSAQPLPQSTASAPTTSAPASSASAPTAPAASTGQATSTGSTAAPSSAVSGLVTQTQAIDTAYAQSIATVKAAVALLGQNPKLSDADQATVSRLSMIGVMLDDADAVKNAPAVTLPKGTNPDQAIAQAETSFMQAVENAAQQVESASNSIDPTKLSQADDTSLTNVQSRISDAIYAIKFANKLAPSPQTTTTTNGTASTGGSTQQQSGAATASQSSPTQGTTPPANTSGAPTQSPAPASTSTTPASQ